MIKNKANKRLIMEGILVVVLFVFIAISFTVAWFTSNRNTEVKNFIIEVKSSDNFQLSLDGVHFENSISIDIDNRTMTIGDDVYDTGIRLTDLAAILNSRRNEADTKTYRSLSIKDPIKDVDTGLPIESLPEGITWTDAVKSTVTKDGDSYYLSSDSLTALAQYIEMDLWIRSDSNLSIYLGSDSTVYPVTTVDDDADFTPAMSSKVEETFDYTEELYRDYTTTKAYQSVVTDENNTKYYFKHTEVDGVDTRTFLVKMGVGQIYNSVTETYDDFNFYYTQNDDYIVRSRTEIIHQYINNTTEELGSCEVFYGSGNIPLFYMKYQTSGDYRSRIFYDSNKSLVASADVDAFFNSYDSGFAQLMKMDYVDAGYGYQKYTTTHLGDKNTYYYDENGSLLVRVHVKNDDTIEYLDAFNNDISADMPAKPYQVLRESYYGSSLDETIGGVFTTKSTTYTFSKNLVAGAALVSFSELVTDTFSVGNTTVAEEVEDLKYLWNPLPNFKLVNDGTYSKYEYEEDRTETIYYYSYDPVTNVYTKTAWDANDSAIHVGNFNTTTSVLGEQETPLVQTKVVSGDKYSVKKIRIKIWLDGNDTISTNSMFNASSAGNGQIKMTINLVANINSTVVDYEYLTRDVGGGITEIVPGKYLVTANKSNLVASDFTFTVSGKWINENNIAIAIAKITPVEGTTNQAIVEFYKYGSVTVYARDVDGRIGQVNISYDYVQLVKQYDPAHPNEYKIYAISPYADPNNFAPEDIITDGTWEISDENVASKTVNVDGSLTVTFTTDATEIITFKCVKTETLNYQQYLASNSIKVSHTYDNTGGE